MLSDFYRLFLISSQATVLFVSWLFTRAVLSQSTEDTSHSNVRGKQSPFDLSTKTLKEEGRRKRKDEDKPQKSGRMKNRTSQGTNKRGSLNVRPALSAYYLCDVGRRETHSNIHFFLLVLDSDT